MNNPAEISSIIKSQIENYKKKVEMDETVFTALKTVWQTSLLSFLTVQQALLRT